MPNPKTLKDTDVAGKKVLFRVDYNVTIIKEGDKSSLLDDMRLKATLPTLNYLLNQGCSVAVLTYLKRPGGKIVEEYRLKPVADRLSQLVGRPVKALNDCVGSEVEAEVRAMKPGEIIMLENARFHPEEEVGDEKFAKDLTQGFDVIVYDAFAQAHRIHSSTTGILQNLPSVAGFLFEKEIKYLSQVTENPQQPFIVVLGGAKISDRVGVMQNLINKADTMLIGGALANTFFKAQGLNVGKSLVEDVYVNAAKGEKQDYLQIARDLMAKAKDKLKLPLDMLAAADAKSSDIKIINLDKGESLPADWLYYDIGPRTVQAYRQILLKAKMVFFNGPMGLFEVEQFAAGTKKVAEAMLESGATTVIGGGDTESIVAKYGWEGRFTHVSTGGGAALEFLAGKEFPVMKYLVKQN